MCIDYRYRIYLNGKSFDWKHFLIFPQLLLPAITLRKQRVNCHHYSKQILYIYIKMESLLYLLLWIINYNIMKPINITKNIQFEHVSNNT